MTQQSTMFRLEMNNSGAWKVVGSFWPQHAEPILDAAELLARGLAVSAGREQLKLRVTCDGRSIAHWDAAAKCWMRAGAAAAYDPCASKDHDQAAAAATRS